jgi:hypothetical protein
MNPRILLLALVGLLSLSSLKAQEMYFFEIVEGSSRATIDGEKLVRWHDIRIVKPPKSGPVKFTSDDRGPKVVFTLIETPPKDWKPKCVIGMDILTTQFSVIRPDEGSDSPTLLVLRHRDGQKVAYWGNHLADFLRHRSDQLRYTPKK